MNLLTLESVPALQAEVRALAAERGAVILAHNYQLPEVQDVADFVGDSLGLSQQAAKTDAEVIVFCGVHFMAETASDPLAREDRAAARHGRRAARSPTPSPPTQLRAWKAKHPGAVVVMYVNTTAEVKAETDYCVTSGNAVQVVEHIPRARRGHEILFGPDMFLGAYVEKRTGRKMHVWDGECHVHAGIRPARHRRHARIAPGRRLPDPSRVRLLDLGDGVRRRR